MNDYDVIIIGAGPAGLNCAKLLGDAAKKVLVLEKNSTVGPKVCGGGITQKALDYFQIPKELVCHKFDDFYYHADKANVKIPARGDQAIFTIDRMDLGQWQLKQINTENVTVLTNKRVVEIHQNEVVVESGERFLCKYLVGADGAQSIARRYLGLKNDKVLVACQYLINDKYKDLEFFYNFNLFRGWYGWIFPHKNYCSVGICGCPTYQSAIEMKKNFLEWLKLKKINIAEATYEAFVINCDYQGYKFGDTFLIGDAAGLASGFTGEGIYQALISGEEIAKLILDNSYEPEKLKRIIEISQKHWIAAVKLSRSGIFGEAITNFAGYLLTKTSFQKRIIEAFFM